MTPVELLRLCVDRLERCEADPDSARLVQFVTPRPIRRHQPPYVELLCVNPKGEHVYLCDPAKVAAWVLRKFYGRP